MKTVRQLRVELANLRKEHRAEEKRLDKEIDQQYEQEFLINLRRG